MRRTLSRVTGCHPGWALSAPQRSSPSQDARSLLLKVPADRARGTRPFSVSLEGRGLPAGHDGRACSSKGWREKGPLGAHGGLQRAWGGRSPGGLTCHHVSSNSPAHPEGDRGDGREDSRQEFSSTGPSQSREATQRSSPGAGHSGPLLIWHEASGAYRRPSSLLPPFGEAVKLDTDISAPALEIKITSGAKQGSVPVYLRHNLKHPFVLITSSRSPRDGSAESLRSGPRCLSIFIVTLSNIYKHPQSWWRCGKAPPARCRKL